MSIDWTSASYRTKIFRQPEYVDWHNVLHTKDVAILIDEIEKNIKYDESSQTMSAWLDIKYRMVTLEGLDDSEVQRVLSQQEVNKKAYSVWA